MTTDTLQIIHKMYYEGRPKRMASLEEQKQRSKVAGRLYDLRVRRGMSPDKALIMFDEAESNE